MPARALLATEAMAKLASFISFMLARGVALLVVLACAGCPSATEGEPGEEGPRLEGRRRERRAEPRFGLRLRLVPPGAVVKRAGDITLVAESHGTT